MFLQYLPSVWHKKGTIRVMVILFSLMVTGSIGVSIKRAAADQDVRAQVNQDWYAIDEYCREREGNFYFEDVYSTVSFSQKMFAGDANTYANYDILGGWMSKSPLYREKLARYDMKEADMALLGKDNVYLIISDREAAEQGLDWITMHYASRGIDVSVQESDRVNENYGVYQINRVK